MALHPPAAALQPWVEYLWASPPRPGTQARQGAREWVLPDGRAHVVIRLQGQPLGLYAEPAAAQPRWLSDAVLAGPHDRAYLKDTSRMAGSVGALLLPGALHALFGIPDHTLLNRHVALADAWPEATPPLLERVNAASSPAAAIALLEAQLLAQLRPARALHPQVALALPRLAQGTPIAELVRHSGYSHRRFAALFREATGMPPKRYACLRRFASTLADAADAVPWSQLALEAGYSDQAHFVRDFHGFARLTPETYRRAPRHGVRHVQAAPAPASTTAAAPGSEPG